MGKKVVIVGGVAGGASAAARLRRLDEEAQIILFERGEYISFANCGLPYYIGESIQDRSKLIVQTPEMMHKRFNIDVRIQSEVTQIDAANKKVTIHNRDKGMYEESFDALILSPGAKPVKPPIPGIKSSRIFTLRNIPDTDRIKGFVDQQTTQSAVIIGGGFIGIEMAENLVERGLEVTVVEAAPYVLAPFDTDMVAFTEKELYEHGVKLALGSGVQSFHEDDKGIVVSLQNGEQLQADITILAIGVQPDTAFLRDSGIALNPKGHILVDDQMRTNLDYVYAVGDAVEVTHYVHGQKTAIPLAGPANKQGRIAADHICGLPSIYKGSQGTSILKLFEMTCASTGLNERTLKGMQIPYHVIHVHPASHATYYPGSSPISLKLIFGTKGEILGAQAFGQDGVDKRIDVIATAMRLKGTVSDLAELELCYAPPFSSAKDPVNMAGFAAENVLFGKTAVWLADDIKQFDREKTMLVDVRTPAEYEKGSIDRAINIPVDELRDRLHELDRNKEIWVFCQVGLRGYTASRILAQKGFKVKNLSGGYKTYSVQY
ncbi:FAD-dependent oxidoreductase [Paenibacillus chondroitinus]|uniref:FAD-dependent oxidoreductase n=1 Tax=Paenibacillus chondroitinus TaxID=59842 RepID=A0ABU6DNM4_9BACL|nr:MULTISPECIES: FAD-dependent oxidoreductase [Paenibacillus]MCY9657158.1 FAD-dependent oxidoreductase [Paenibacillus anseongense]MEB4798441.1 FAD-dependent oxidoreductase [Paenibacillus chondroitinus]